MVLVVNKVDRPDARIGEVVDEVYELFLDLDANEEQIEFPIVYTNAKAGWASTEEGVEGSDLRPLLDLLVERIPAPEYDESHPLQARVTNLDADPYVGRLALCRVHHGTLRKGQQVAWIKRDGAVAEVRVSELYVNEGLERQAADEAGPGEIIALAGIPEITIGETIADPADPRPLPVIAIDEPALAVTIGINSSPLAGPVGHAPDRAPGAGPARAGWSGTWRSAWSTRTGATPGRSRAAASFSWPCWSRRCAARVRADGRQAAGRDARDRRQAARADRAALDRRPGGLPGRRDADAGAPQGTHGEHGQPRHRLGAAGLPHPGARPHRLPYRVPHRDARHGDPALGLRALRALAGRDPHAADRLAGGGSPRAHGHLRPPPSSRSAGSCSSARARRSTKEWSSARTRGRTTWT